MSTAKDRIARSPGPSSLRANRDFILLWTAGVTSGLGSQLTLVAYPLLVLALNGTPTQAGLLGTAGLVTRTVLGLPAGALVDRWDRRRVMLWCDSIRAAALLAVIAAVAAGGATVGLLLVAVVVESACGVFFLPAERAALRSVVPVERLSSALAINQAREFAAELAGPPLGGLLLDLGRALPFLGDALSYVRTPVLNAGLIARRGRRTAGHIALRAQAPPRWTARRPRRRGPVDAESTVGPDLDTSCQIEVTAIMRT